MQKRVQSKEQGQNRNSTEQKNRIESMYENIDTTGIDGPCSSVSGLYHLCIIILSWFTHFIDYHHHVLVYIHIRIHESCDIHYCEYHQWDYGDNI